MPDIPLASAARTLSRRLDELGRVSDERGKLTRTFLSPAMRRANARVSGWMRAAGMKVREDGVGNLIGRLEGSAPEGRDRHGRGKTFLLGSHLDTVRDAGRFDGALGVLLAIEAVAELRRRRVGLPFAIEILGFSEEEGVRFSSAYLGSKGYCGLLTSADLGRRDPRGISVREAIGAALGGPFKIPGRAHSPSDLLGYLEVHIEQGPVLEARARPTGVVTGIAGQTRARIAFEGRAGHAGTTPMGLRRDALAGAAEFVLAAEALALAGAPLVATVGGMAVAPGAANVVPGRAEFPLDIRHPRDAGRRAALRSLRAAGREIARRRGLKFSFTVTQDNAAVACSRRLTAVLERSVRARQGRCPALASGAGHDAVVLSELTPVAMLFVRCRGGVSHHPGEHVGRRDLATALRIVVDFLGRLASGRQIP